MRLGRVWAVIGASWEDLTEFFAYLRGALEQLVAFLRISRRVESGWRRFGRVLKAFWGRLGVSTKSFCSLGGDVTVIGNSQQISISVSG